MLVRTYRQPYAWDIALFINQGVFQELTPLAEGGAILQSDEEEMGKWQDSFYVLGARGVWGGKAEWAIANPVWHEC